jgi:(2Fe-2S) ferredoxin
VVVHPDGIKYHNVTAAALEQIFNAHILGQQPVEALIIQRF